MSKQYILHICIADEEEQFVDIQDKLIFGSSADSDVTFEAPHIAPKHLIFRVNNGILTVRNSSLQGETKLGDTLLRPKKMVILDTGDIITIGDLQLKISLQDNENEEQVLKANKPEELPTATTLFKLAKAELEQDGPGTDERESTITPTVTDKQTAEHDEVETEEHIEEAIDIEEEEEEENNNPTDVPPEKLPSFLHRLFRRVPSATSSPLMKKSILQKILYKLKFKSRGAQAPMIISSSQEPPLFFLSRLYALLFSYITAYTIYANFTPTINQILHDLFSLLPTAQVQLFLNKVLPYWHYIPSNLAVYLEKIYPIFLLVLMLDILGALLFAAPFPLLLLGVQTTGNVIIKRVQALIKAVLGILHPLLIFDLPLLLSKPSVKELITGSRYGAPKSKFLSLLGHIILLPLMLIVLLSPFIWEIATNQHFPLVKEPVSLKALPLEKDNETYDYQSKFFNFTITDIKETIISIPQKFNVQQSKFHLVTIYNQQAVKISLEKIEGLEQLHNYLVFHNPFYRFYNMRYKYDFATEVLTIFRLNAKPHNILEFAKQYGIILNPEEKYKQRFLSLLHMTKVDSLQLVQGTTKYLKLVDQNTTHFLTLKKPYLHITYRHTSKNKKLAKLLPKLLLAKLKYLHRPLYQVDILNFSNRFDPFTYLDIALMHKPQALQDYYALYYKTLLNVAQSENILAPSAVNTIAQNFAHLQQQLCADCPTIDLPKVPSTKPDNESDNAVPEKESVPSKQQVKIPEQ